ncbi:hypothetical protein CLAFUW4_10359 [Fulvia fulva]|uniref:Uncharacterized protein n=1 Tax=Passalora fulva TaxID=5499 RepID=A0A9Q8P7Y9_PASFU|nr:uncharacterized protein CLAFUR5_04974 [Fulvia fulva]KAK4615786.1 hypothetical protein CLAFUR4_10363 [Fulvia fulva]KAK4616885.1 hypothetical protein CLAFUR0_10363 [Fulvia fulva]UJO16528.1 hypothetical protein CLAFUR5_04974 [Fulvia fulva]WPV19439.1 hypothetical protein CLAFUW4_10359 [Fulvia fulva]WPV34481.1 hypothetical protein CLAFUW7_10359 [Fulvia fulva]
MVQASPTRAPRLEQESFWHTMRSSITEDAMAKAAKIGKSTRESCIYMSLVFVRAILTRADLTSQTRVEGGKLQNMSLDPTLGVEMLTDDDDACID